MNLILALIIGSVIGWLAKDCLRPSVSGRYHVFPVASRLSPAPRARRFAIFWKCSAGAGTACTSKRRLRSTIAMGSAASI